MIRLEREKSNARKRELRTKSHMRDIIKELKEKNFVNEELCQRLGLYAGKNKLKL